MATGDQQPLPVSIGRLICAGLGTAGMVLGAWRGWPVSYLLGGLLVVVGLWPLSRALARRGGRSPRWGATAVVLVVLAAVAVPALHAWRLYRGDVTWAVEHTEYRDYRHTGGLLVDQYAPAVLFGVDGTSRDLVPRTFYDRIPDHTWIAGIAPEVGAVVHADEGDAFWYRWQESSPTPLPGGLEGDQASVAAITASTAVLFKCTDGEGCLYTGYDVDGNQRWQLEVAQPSDVAGYHTRSLLDQIEPAPGVVITGTDPLTVRDPETGEPLSEYPGRAAVLDGDVLIAVEPDGRQCRLTAARGADELWTTTLSDTACKHPELAGAYIVFTEESTVLLVDRETREVTQVQRARWEAARQVVGHTLIFDGDEGVVGVDGRTGSGTWIWQPDGPRGIVGAGPGHVLVGTRPTGWNPFISAQVREEGLLLQLLEAATGRTVVRAVHPEPIDATIVLDGAFAIDDEGVLTSYGPRPPDPRS